MTKPFTARFLIAVLFLLNAFVLTHALASEFSTPEQRAVHEAKLALLVSKAKVLMETSSLELSDELFVLRNNFSDDSQKSILENYHKKADQIWNLIAEGLEVSKNKYLSPEQSRFDFNLYIRWYTRNAIMIFESIDPTLEQASKILSHFFVISQTKPHLMIGIVEENFSAFEYQVASAYQNHIQSQRLKMAQSLLNKTHDLEQLKPLLTFSSEILFEQSKSSTNISDNERHGVAKAPRQKQWLIGLTELVLDGDVFAFEYKNGNDSKKTLDKLYSAYLRIYEDELLEFIKTSQNSRADMWMVQLALNPITHIAQAKKNAPKASSRALDLLKLVETQSVSKILSKSALKLETASKPGFFKRCAWILKFGNKRLSEAPNRGQT